MESEDRKDSSALYAPKNFWSLLRLYCQSRTYSDKSPLTPVASSAFVKPEIGMNRQDIILTAFVGDSL